MSFASQSFIATTIIVFYSVAHSGTNTPQFINELSQTGELGDKDFSLYIKRNKDSAARIQSFSLMLDGQELEVPIEELRNLNNPILREITISLIKPGFTGLIAKSLDSETNTKNFIEVSLPLGEVAYCYDENGFETEESGGHTIYYFSYSLDGSLVDTELRSACWPCNQEGNSCELD